MSHPEIIGIIIAAIAALFIWKGLHTGVTNWLLLVAGILAAGLLSPWLVPVIRQWPLYAGGITLVIWAVFYAEVIKKADPHFIRTSVAAVATGASLVLCIGAVGQVITQGTHQIGPSVTSVVHQANGTGQG